MRTREPLAPKRAPSSSNAARRKTSSLAGPALNRLSVLLTTTPFVQALVFLFPLSPQLAAASRTRSFLSRTDASFSFVIRFRHLNSFLAQAIASASLCFGSSAEPLWSSFHLREPKPNQSERCKQEGSSKETARTNQTTRKRQRWKDARRRRNTFFSKCGSAGSNAVAGTR